MMKFTAISFLSLTALVSVASAYYLPLEVDGLTLAARDLDLDLDMASRDINSEDDIDILARDFDRSGIYARDIEDWDSALQPRELDWEEVFAPYARRNEYDDSDGLQLLKRGGKPKPGVKPSPRPAAKPAPRPAAKPAAKSNTMAKVKTAAKIGKEAASLISDGVGLGTDIATGDVPKAVFDAIKLTIDAIFDAINAIKGQERKDALARGQFTKGTVSQLRQKHPQFNFVMIHTAHHYKFPGARGKDWYHEHRELPVGFPVHSTIGFEIYGFRKGEFFRDGDGGFQNWAYNGVVTKNDGNGKHMVFAPPK